MPQAQTSHLRQGLATSLMAQWGLGHGQFAVLEDLSDGASRFLMAWQRGSGSTQPLEEEGQLEKVWSGCHREANPSV